MNFASNCCLYETKHSYGTNGCLQGVYSKVEIDNIDNDSNINDGKCNNEDYSDDAMMIMMIKVIIMIVMIKVIMGVAMKIMIGVPVPMT